MISAIFQLLGSGKKFTVPLNGLTFKTFIEKLKGLNEANNKTSWTLIQETDSKITLRLNEFNKYGFPPRIEVSGYSDQELQVRIYQTDLVKALMLFWLFLCVIGYSALALYLLQEIVSGDGLLTVTNNGIEREVSFFLWVPIFILIHFILFFVVPANALSKGLRDSRKIFDPFLPISHSLFE